MEELREFVITCSMYEIYLDKVRDLGAAFMDKTGLNSSKVGKEIRVYLCNISEL